MSQSKEVAGDVEFGEGFILPPLIVQLRKILDQYADDCQILKELVQNAEDAGAKEVKFLYDRHSYGTNPNLLHKASLAKFQGPALYAFNDGLFDDEDWKGIRMLSQSVKQDDPFKVGYFGMGFKSVFHITDLPFILSGERVGVIDPHQKHFDGTTYGWSMAKRKDLLEKYRHQFEPFLGLFGCTEETFRRGFYNGTIFRFPLRHTASPLSDVIYSNEKTEMLYESFQDNAHEVPLFLKHLEKIQLYERDKFAIEPKLVFEVRIAKECVCEVRQQRADFMNQTRAGGVSRTGARQWMDQPIVATYPITIETVLMEKGKEKVEQYKYLVTNYYSGGSVSAIFRKLYRDPDLNYPPWVGLAMPLDIPAEETFQLQDTDGHVFCFLPLSLEQKTPTGLPVHVNGFFALEQNRKYLKWAGTYRTREELMDKRLLWNQCLLREAIPRAYVHLLLAAIRMHQAPTPAAPNITTDAIYRAFPSFHCVDRKWEVILLPLFTELFKHEVVHTSGTPARWIMAKDAIFNTLENSHGSQDIILEALSKSDVSIANVPPHVLDAIKRCCHMNMGKITAHIVANAFKTVQNQMSMPWEDKIEVLRYFLKQGKYDLLDGLELLPLSHGGFTMFYYNPRKAERPIYIATDTSPQCLLPGLEDDFLDEEIDPDVKAMLRRASEKGYTQLKVLTPELLVQLLQKCVPAGWLEGGPVTWQPSQHRHPPSDWLERTWTYLSRTCPADLTAVHNLPIIPMSSDGDTTTLAPLSSANALICKELDGTELDAGSEAVLARLGVHVIESELPSYIKAHPLVARRYVFSPTYMGVLKCLVKLTHSLGLEGVVAKIQELSTEDKRQLRGLCAKISSYELKAEYKMFLQKLPLFETRAMGEGSEKTFVSFSECSLGAPNETLPIHVSCPLLELADVDSLNLANLLGVTQLSMVQLLCQIVFSDIAEAFYEPADVERVMLYVLRHYHFFLEMDPGLKAMLRSLPFILRHDMFVMPDRFYDPDHELLRRLFYDEDNFPPGAYAEPAMTAILREIGLRGLRDVEPEDILETAYKIQDMEATAGTHTHKVLDKSNALLEYLQKYSGELAAGPRADLFSALKDIRWVRRMEQRPAFYPKALDWFSSPHLLEKPCDTVPKQYTNLAGSVLPTHAYEMRGGEAGMGAGLVEAFGWHAPPPLPAILRHFATVVQQYDGTEKAKFMDIAASVYTLLAARTGKEGREEEKEEEPMEELMREMQEIGLEEYIWHGEGFCRPQQVVFSESFMDLRPFVFPLPTEMAVFGDFFSRCGVRESCHLPSILTTIKAKYDAGPPANTRWGLSEVKRDLHICVSVLNELKGTVQRLREAGAGAVEAGAAEAGAAEAGTEAEAETGPGAELRRLQEELVLPLHVEGRDVGLKMAPLTECTFCDQEWLRQGHDLGDWVDGEESMQFVHPNVPTATSETLGVPTLMSRMLDVEELDFSFGQSDSLTHRLSVLLTEYTDGFAVPKELVQNADDAGATEVRLLWDERENVDARTCLIDEGMRECQGPALWVHNNAVFSDADFDNITKLSGATKEQDTDKIGRFGLGFNAVYNLTDVPSFISRQNIVIFDPHTTHLGKSIKNKSKPGIKINMKKHRRKLKRLGNQFAPYNDVFGCDLRPDARQDSYPGTLFRFPLRTQAQAIRSEICQRHYDAAQMKALLRMLVRGAESLLLFTQNVLRIKLFHLPSHARSPTSAVQVFSISKSPAKILRELQPLSALPEVAESVTADEKSLLQQSAILREATAVMKQLRHGTTPDQFPASSLVMDIHRTVTSDGERLLADQSVTRTMDNRPWLVCSLMGQGEALKLAIQEDSLLSTAGIALPLKRVRDFYLPEPLVLGSAVTGSVFTYLPLPIRSGLPLHINAAFAVTSNRRYLCERNDDDKLDLRAIWNQALLQDCVAAVYFQALHDLTTIVPCQHSAYHTLWPHPKHIESNMKPLMQTFYKSLVGGSAYSLAILSDQKQYVSMEKAVYLAEDVTQHEKVLSVVTAVLEKSSHCVVEMPAFVLQACLAQDSEQAIVPQKAYNIHRLFQEVFLPGITEMSAKQRDTLLLHILQADNATDVKALLADAPCIPASPDGEQLKSPKDLVDPQSELAHLYLAEDGRFPHGAYSQQAVLKSLRHLGMAQKLISWHDLCERAQAIAAPQALNALKRSKVLLAFLEMKLESSGGGGEQQEDGGENGTWQETLRSLALLPVLHRPAFFPLGWASDALGPGVLLAAEEVVSGEYKDLVCLVAPVLDDSVLPRSSDHVRRFFSFPEPQLATVLEQLDTLIDSATPTMLADRQVSNEIQRMCYQIYTYLQTTCVDDGHREVIGEALADKRFILCQNRFLLPSQLSFSFTHNCSPYIFSVSEMLKRNFTELLKVAGVKETFVPRDYVLALQSMHAEHGTATLDKERLKLALQLVSFLNDSMAELNQTLSEVVEQHGTIYIPDAAGVLRSSSALCFNEPEVHWVPTAGYTNYSHPLIPFTISKQLGVNTKRQEVLKKHSRGIPFGQRERLTNRLKRILSSYPCDKEILKELLQNADDAGASQIHFVLDPRQHRAEKVFDESWKPLQGPALCVFNDTPFTEADLEGIKKLGEGSKGTDPNKTGQYGVGFNCVYHLTDAPSFLTAGPHIGQTLCVFDPHAKFVPGATVDEPGRRYDDVSELREIFTDVFPCYLEDKFPMQDGGTMFRFPLRTVEMASESELSEQVIGVEMVETLLNKFKADMLDCLLFVNHVRTIAIHQVDKRTGRLSQTYSVSVELSAEDQERREHFSTHVAVMGAAIKAGDHKQIWDMGQQDVTYVLTLTDNKGYGEKWLVHQSVGFPEGSEIPASVREAFQRGDLSLLPRGGAATLLHSSTAQHQRGSRAFCFLPLPLRTGLPVNVNGHFALDTEARRHLWHDEEGSAKTEWNFLLLRHVIAPCYVALMANIPQHSPALSFSNEQSASAASFRYSDMFPRLSSSDPYWRVLAEAIYVHIHESQQPVLPVVRPSATGEQQVEWLTTTGVGMAKPYFDNLDDTVPDSEAPAASLSIRQRKASASTAPSPRETIRKVLLASGFKLLCLPLDILAAFHAAGVSMAQCVHPRAVMDFYRNYRRPGSYCSVPALPASICDTPFQSVEGLKELLTYCSQDAEAFYASLDGLPFLLCEDSNLRQFSSREKIYLTKYHALLPDCDSIFVHRALVPCFSGVNTDNHNVFLRLDITALAEMLSTSLPEVDFRSEATHVEWAGEESSVPSPRWVWRLWTFLREEFERIRAKQTGPVDDEELAKLILRPLQDWAILPAHIHSATQPAGGAAARAGAYYNNEAAEDMGQQFLVPIGLANTILDFSQTSIVNHAFRESLRKLGLPELSTSVLDSGPAGVKSALVNSGLCQLLVASLESPRAVLAALHYAIEFKGRASLLKMEECYLILKYFNDCVASWREDGECVLMLRQLPMYLSAHGQLVRLGRHTAYVLPGDLPQHDMDAWEKQASIVFLRRQPGLEQLHHAINCSALSATELYTKYIFRNFEYLSEEGRLAHMEFIRDVKLPQLGGNFRKSFIEALHDLAWLPATSDTDAAAAADKQYKRACDFHDPYHPVFKVMLEPSCGAFPPAPFNSFKWLDFLRLIGLQHTVSQDRLIEFAERVAFEATQETSEDTFNKSRTLVTHLFKRNNVATEDVLLAKISDIPFIPAGSINPMMEKIFPAHASLEAEQHPYIRFKDGVPENHEVLIWSSAYILPDWANPYKLTEADVSFNFPPCEEEAGGEGEEKPPMKCEEYTHMIARRLGINEDPSAEQVVEHTRNVCSNIYTQLTDLDELRAFMKVDVMKKVYKFLQQKCMDTDVARLALEDTCCIVVDLGYTFVKPCQVVIDLYEEDQIVPYLYKVPTELGEFKKLFIYLGATSNPTFDQYSMVLESIYQQTQGDKLHPNELRAAFKAVFELFTGLKRHPNTPVKSRSLILPSVSGRLYSATELVFNNDPTYTDRIKFFEKPFLVELSECMLDREVNYEELIKLLPEHLQPAMLTDLVQENLEDECFSTMVSFSVSDKLRHQLNSRAFCLGLQRIIKHEQRRSGQKVGQEQMDVIQYTLKRIRVFGVHKLVTFLSYRGVKIPQSECECECFHDRTFNVEENEDQWNIYVDNQQTLNDELLVSVAEVVNKIAGGLLRNSVHYLQPIISCAPHAISKVLDRLKVRPDHSVDFRQPTLPVPGSFIPVEEHHLLKEDFELYQPGEYVGYELEDDDVGGPTFIYAIILERIPDRSSVSSQGGSKLTQKYKINVGDDRKILIAMVTDLYKFHRVEGFVSRNASVDPDYFYRGSSSSPHTPRTPHTPRSYGDHLGDPFDHSPHHRPTTPSSHHRSPKSPFNRIDEEGGYAAEGAGETPPPQWSNFNLNGHHSSTPTRPPPPEIHIEDDDDDAFEAGPSFRDQFFQTEEEQQAEREARMKARKEKEEAEAAAAAAAAAAANDSADGAGDAKPKGGPVIPEMTEGDTIEDVLERVSDTLEEAWEMQEKERKKIIKRLLLKWHPDKNIGNEQIATIVTQHIQGEIERLNEGRPRAKDFKDFVAQFNFDSRNPFSGSTTFQETFYNAYQYFFDQVNQRAKAHRENRERYKEYFSKEYSSTHTEFNFDVPPSFSSSNPQPAQAKRFLRQAQEDLRATDNDYDAREPAYEWVCFKAHQAAEKALKAAQFSVDATTSFNHDLASIAATLEDLELRRLAMRLQKIIGNANKLYNPDPIEFVIIPHDEYSKEAACDAIMCAADILERVKEFVEIKEL